MIIVEVYLHLYSCDDSMRSPLVGSFIRSRGLVDTCRTGKWARPFICIIYNITNMKHKLLFCIAMLMTSVIIFAQDIIVTTDAQKIEAKILEVSKSEIKYKEKDNIEGPTFVLDTDEINSIIYSNGKVVLYNQTPKKESPQVAQSFSNDSSVAQIQTNQTGNTATILLRSGETLTVELLEMKTNFVAYKENGERKTMPATQINTVTLANGQVKDYSTYMVSNNTNTNTNTSASVSSTETKGGRIYRDNREYLYNGTYISSKEVERILQRENHAAYEKWQNARGMEIGGAICTGIGSGMVLGGLITLITGNYMPCIILDCAALVPLGVGLGLCLGASSRYNQAIDIYNSKYDQATVQLRWSVAPNGIGLALAF